MRKDGSYAKIIIFGSIFLMLALVIFFSKLGEKELRKNILKDSTIVVGKVLDYTPPRFEASCVVTYSFMLGIHCHTEDESNGLYEPLHRYLVGKTFPIIVNARNYKYNKILIVPKDFEEFGIPFPDSLQWVKDILK